MDLISQLQNFNIVESPRCDLIENGQWFEMASYKTEAKCQQDITSRNSLLVSATNNARLSAHWAGFVSSVEGYAEV